MRLFEPDLFSSSRPEFVETDAEENNLIKELITKHYFNNLKAIKILRLGALEVNSNNYKVEVDSSQYILKKLNTCSYPSTYEIQLRYSLEINNHRGTFPSVVKSKDDSLIVPFNNTYWVMISFLKGTYITKEKVCLETLGNNIGFLFKLMSKVNGEGLPKSLAIGCFDKFYSSHARFAEVKSHIKDFFPEKEANLLLDYYPLIMSSNDIVCENMQLLAELEVYPCHIDLHPHNILCSSPKSFHFLDVESLQLSYQSISIAFAIFKLYRQFAITDNLRSYSNSEISHGALAFSNYLLNQIDTKNYDTSKFMMYALFEVLRRLYIITDLNILHRKTIWNQVLQIQLSALQEIPIIFKRF